MILLYDSLGSKIFLIFGHIVLFAMTVRYFGTFPVLFISFIILSSLFMFPIFLVNCSDENRDKNTIDYLSKYVPSFIHSFTHPSIHPVADLENFGGRDESTNCV